MQFHKSNECKSGALLNINMPVSEQKFNNGKLRLKINLAEFQLLFKL